VSNAGKCARCERRPSPSASCSTSADAPSPIRLVLAAGAADQDKSEGGGGVGQPRLGAAIDGQVDKARGQIRVPPARSSAWPADAHAVYNFGFPGVGAAELVDRLLEALDETRPRAVAFAADFLDIPFRRALGARSRKSRRQSAAGSASAWRYCSRSTPSEAST
jgi:hypothetical protein